MKCFLVFQVGRFDEAGHLLGEDRLPNPFEVPLLYPYAVSPEAIQDAVQQIEASVNDRQEA